MQNRAFSLQTVLLALFLLTFSLVFLFSATEQRSAAAGPPQERGVWQKLLSEEQAKDQAGPGNPETNFWIAVANANLGRIDQATEAFRKADSLDQRHAFVGRITNWAGVALRTNSTDLMALNALAFTAYAAEKYGTAADAFARVVAADPSNPWPRNYLGFSLGQAHRLNEATRVLEETVRLFPQNQYSHFLLGLAYYHKGMLIKAIKEFAKAPQAVSRFR